MDGVIPKHKFVLPSQKHESYYIVILIQTAYYKSIVKRSIFERYDPELFSFFEKIIGRQDYKIPLKLESTPESFEKFVCTRFVCELDNKISSWGYNSEATDIYNELENIL